MLDTVKQEKYIHSNSFCSSDNEIIMRFVQTHTRMGDILTEVFPTKSTSGEAKERRAREREERMRKDADNSGNSRSFAYYRSSPIPTL